MTTLYKCDYNTPRDGMQSFEAFVDETGWVVLIFSQRKAPIRIYNCGVRKSYDDLTAEIASVMRQSLAYTTTFFRYGTTLQMLLTLTRHKIEDPE